MVAGLIRGALYRVENQDQLDLVISVWPSAGEGEAQLQTAASEALKQGRGIRRPQQAYGSEINQPEKNRTCDLIASPLRVDGKPMAVVAAMISPRSEPQQQAVLQLIQWGGVWLETLIHQQLESQERTDAFTLALVSSVLSCSASRLAAMEIVNRLAEKMHCERVSIGFRKGLGIRLQAVSQLANFDPRTQLVRNIEAAMEEAVNQATALTFPGSPAQASLITRAHSELSAQQRQGAICTLPLQGRLGTIGAITLERAASQPFDEKTVAWGGSLAKLIGPVLEIKQREERSIWAKGIAAFKDLVAGLLGASRLKLKLSLIGIMAALCLLYLVDGTYKVTAPANIEGESRQLLVAPQDGYVKQAKVRAGDVVKQGQLIASLDDRNLQLERSKWLSERNKIEKEYQDALAKRERTKLSVSRAQLDQVDAELRLSEEKIARTQLRAPIDGIILNGDLSQSLGSPVEIGQVLFEVAPLNSYRVVLEVDEHDVAELHEARPGQLIIAALPESTFALSLQQIKPVAVSENGHNFFRVEANLVEPSKLLRPGMRGVAKVEIGQRKLLWIWTHSLIDRLRLWAWSIGF